MYAIIEKTSGYVVDVCMVNLETRKMLEDCGFICRKVVEK